MVSASICSISPWAWSKNDRTCCAGVLAERRRSDQRVDEVAVALVGGDAAGAGVGLDEVALLLEQRHLVADRGRRHLRPRARRRRGPSPPAGRCLDVLLHDGPEDGGLAFVEHGGGLQLGPRSPTAGPPGLALDATECLARAVGRGYRAHRRRSGAGPRPARRRGRRSGRGSRPAARRRGRRRAVHGSCTAAPSRSAQLRHPPADVAPSGSNCLALASTGLNTRKYGAGVGARARRPLPAVLVRRQVAVDEVLA